MLGHFTTIYYGKTWQHAELADHARHPLASFPTKEAQQPFFAGIDLGGTNIKVGVVDDLGRTLSWLSIPTEVENGPEDAARRMGAAVHQAIRDAGLEPPAVARVGLGSPGGMDIPSGMLDDGHQS